MLRDDGSVDDRETTALRAQLQSARRYVPIAVDERDPYEGVKGRHRVFRLPPTLATSLGLVDSDLAELRGRHPAPLRGWVRVDAAAAGDVIPLDAFGRAVLGVGAGDTVEVRRLPMPPIPGGMAQRDSRG